MPSTLHHHLLPSPRPPFPLTLPHRYLSPLDPSIHTMPTLPATANTHHYHYPSTTYYHYTTTTTLHHYDVLPQLRVTRANGRRLFTAPMNTLAVNKTEGDAHGTGTYGILDGSGDARYTSTRLARRLAQRAAYTSANLGRSTSPPPTTAAPFHGAEG